MNLFRLRDSGQLAYVVIQAKSFDNSSGCRAQPRWSSGTRDRGFDPLDKCEAQRRTLEDSAAMRDYDVLSGMK